jgi:hypothetical protein
MKRLNYKISIQKPAALVYDKMLGISDKSSYQEWTTIFSPTSSYEGDWTKGNKMLFVSVDDKGKKAGMVSRILENDENKFVSIQHYGMLKAGEEIVDGPEVEEWAGGLENYTLESEGDTTIVSIDIDSAEEHEEYMDKLYPNALLKLKEICERN